MQSEETSFRSRNLSLDSVFSQSLVGSISALVLLGCVHLFAVAFCNVLAAHNLLWHLQLAGLFSVYSESATIPYIVVIVLLSQWSRNQGARGATSRPNDSTGGGLAPPIIMLHVIVYIILYHVCILSVQILLLIIT